MSGRALIALLPCLTALAPPSATAERVVWDKAPIAVRLTVERERRVGFPAAVRVGVPSSLTGALRTQSLDGTVYWLAREAFPPTRVQVQETESGRVYLLDLEARQADGPADPLEVALPAPLTDETPADAGETVPSAGYETLVRYAAQRLYAPARLLRDVPGIWRIPVDIPDPMRLVGGRNAGAVAAVPVAAWRTRGHYVTAVRLTNLTREALVLDPRELRGRWLAATFQHARLLPAGDEADTTAVYLISEWPYGDSL